MSSETTKMSAPRALHCYQDGRKPSDPMRGDYAYDEHGEIRVMAFADGYVMGFA